MTIFTYVLVFSFINTLTTEIYTLSLHDALPIYSSLNNTDQRVTRRLAAILRIAEALDHSHRQRVLKIRSIRSEEHTSELQSHSDLVCRLLLEKKKQPISS